MQESKTEINKEAPKFEADAYHKDEIVKIKLDDFKGKWVILFFYPGDFTFVCPTELGELADKYADIKKIGAEIVSVSTDTVHVHKAWFDTSETIKKIKFPMLADPTGNICRDYGTYIYDEGKSLRGTFIINPEGILKSIELNDNDIGRSSAELIERFKQRNLLENIKARSAQ